MTWKPNSDGFGGQWVDGPPPPAQPPIHIPRPDEPIQPLGPGMKAFLIVVTIFAICVVGFIVLAVYKVSTG